MTISIPPPDFKLPRNFRLDADLLDVYNRLVAKGQAGAFINRCIRQDAKAYLTKLAKQKRNFKRGLNPLTHKEKT